MSEDVTFGRTIQLFLVDGKPTGLRKVTIHDWQQARALMQEVNT